MNKQTRKKTANAIKREKGALLIIAVAFLTEGMQAINTERYINGFAWIFVSALLFYVREHYKFHRWKFLEEE